MSIIKKVTVNLAVCSALFMTNYSTQTGTLGVNSAQAQGVLEEVVVSARRREENVFEVPQTIIVLGAEKIEKQKITTIPDVASLYPNIGYTYDLSPTSTFISVRGLGSSRNTDPAIAIVVDGVQASNASVTRQELFDIEQIEVLKGPQGSLYGRNASGGAFNITTKKPTNETMGNISVGYGNVEAVDVNGALSGALIEDQLYYRVAGSYHDDEGSVMNRALDLPVDFSTNQTFRARLFWEPTANFSADARFSIDDMETGTYFHAITREIGTPHRGRHANSNGSAYDASPNSNPISVAFGQIVDVSLKLDYDFGPVKVTSITAVNDTWERYGRIGEGRGRGARGEGPGDFGWTNGLRAEPPLGGSDFGNEQTYKVDSVSQEFRILSNDTNSNLRWDIGGYFIFVDRDDSLPVYVDFDGDGILHDETFVINPKGTEKNTDAFAVFANVDYDFTDALTFSVGLRYDEENRNQTNRDDPTPAAFQEASFDDIQPKFSLSYQANDSQIFYGTVSRGFRSGGFNVPISTFPVVYDKETLWSYEIGHKGRYLDNRLQINLAAFYEDITDKATFSFDSRTVSQTTFSIPKSEVYGLEADATFAVSDSLTLGVAAGWMDSEIKEMQFAEFFPINIPGLGEQLSIDFASAIGTGVIGGVTNADFKGNKLDAFSHWSLTFTGDFIHPVGDSGWDLIVHADYAVRGDNYWEVTNTDVEKDVHLLNGNVSLEKDNWAVSFWATNLLDTDYWSSWYSGAFQGLPDIGHKATERRFGGTIKYSF
jgi:iron complex outermembrane recepter protein